MGLGWFLAFRQPHGMDNGYLKLKTNERHCWSRTRVNVLSVPDSSPSLVSRMHHTIYLIITYPSNHGHDMP